MELQHVDKWWFSTVDSALARAIESDDLETLEALLADHPDVDAQDSFGNSALHHAAQHAGLETCRLIINANANVDIADADGATPLLCAVLLDNLDCIDLLLGAKASPDLADSDGATPLALAASMGSTECSRLLLAAGANGPRALRQCMRTRYEPFFSLHGHAKDMVLDTLLLAGVDPSEECPSGCSLLAWAIREGRDSAVGWLLDADADPDGSDRHGTSALAFAVDHGKYAITHALLAAGATNDPCSTVNKRLFGWRRLTPVSDSLQAGVTHVPPLSLSALPEDLIGGILDHAGMEAVATIALSSKGWHKHAVQTILRPLLWEHEVEDDEASDDESTEGSEIEHCFGCREDTDKLLRAAACRMSPSEFSDLIATFGQFEVFTSMPYAICHLAIAGAAKNTMARGVWTPEMLLKATMPVVEGGGNAMASHSARDIRVIASSVKLDTPSTYAKLVPAAFQKAGWDAEGRMHFLIGLCGKVSHGMSWDDIEFSVGTAEKLAELTVRLTLPTTELIAIASELKDLQTELELRANNPACRDNPHSWALALLQKAFTPLSGQGWSGCPWPTEDISTCLLAIAPQMIADYFGRHAFLFSPAGASALSSKLGTLAGSVSVAALVTLFRTMAQQEAARQPPHPVGAQPNQNFEYTRLFLQHFSQAASNGPSRPHSWSPADGILFSQELARQSAAVRADVAPVVLRWAFELQGRRPKLAARLLNATSGSEVWDDE